MSLSSTLSKFGQVLWSIVAPKSQHGKTRRSIILVLILFIIFGSISYPQIWNKAPKPLQSFFAKPFFQYFNKPFRLGLDLQGGTHLVYKANVSNIPDSEKADAVAGVRDVIERRVNSFGVAEPLIQTNKSGSDYRIIADLAGVKDVAQAIKLIGETPILEFKEQGNEIPRQLTDAEKKDLASFNAKATTQTTEALKKALLSKVDFKALVKQYASPEFQQNSDTGLVAGIDVNNPNYQLVQVAIFNKLKVGQVNPKAINLNNSENIFKLEEIKNEGLEFLSSHILICYTGAPSCSNTRSKTEAKTLIDNLKKQSNSANFGALALKNSNDPGSGAKNGDLGWAGPGFFVPEFDKTLATLKKGVISEVFETQFGYHIIYKRDERPAVKYRLSKITIKTKTEADYLPAQDGWKNTQLSGKYLKRASLEFNSQTGEPQVSIQFDSEGDKLFADITGRNIGKPVAIFLDGSPISIPTVQQKITGGTAVITGNFSVQDGKDLAKRLNAGALPVPITLESQQTIGASLGADSLASSLNAGLIGLLVVALFMILYYRLPGFLSIIALGMYMGINLALYKLIPVTLSLSGIAGLILSVGMAVDANVLIFERMKEELLSGRPLNSALDEGFARAWTSIRDSNFTTLISCVILFYTSSSLIKGFALTLGLGVLVSMFSAIIISKTLLRFVMMFPKIHKIWLFLPGFNRTKKEDKL